jgi:hypothetical protein
VQGDGGAERPKLSSLIGHFVGHVFLGTVAFIALAIPAILLSIAAHYLDPGFHTCHQHLTWPALLSPCY